MGDGAKPGVEDLRAMLENEIDRELGPQRGCWPLLVGLGGALLGLALLARLLCGPGPRRSTTRGECRRGTPRRRGTRTGRRRLTGPQPDAALLPGGHMGFLPDPLHPAVIHFPIALALVALLVELLARVPRWRALEPAAALLITLAALGGIAAVVTGDLAHDEAVVPAGAHDLVEQHEELGEIAMWSLVGLAAARLLLGWRRRFSGALPWAYLVLAAAAAGLVAYNGHLGGRLVFDHGVGTAPMQRAAPPR